MSGLIAYVAGLPEYAHALIEEALDEGYGKGLASIETLDLSQNTSLIKLREAPKNSAVITVIFGEGAYERGQKIEKGLYNTAKFHHYEDDRGLALYLNEEHGAELEVPEEAPVVDAMSYGDVDEESVADTASGSLSEEVGYRNDGALRLENQELHSQVVELTRQLEDSFQPVEPLMNDDEIRALEKKANTLESIADQLKTQNKSLGKSKDLLEVENKALKTNVASKDERLSIQAAKISLLESEAENTERLKSRLKVAEEQRDFYKDSSDSANSSIRTLTDANTGLSETVSNLRSQVSGAEKDGAEVARLNKIIDQLKSDQTSTSTRLDNATKIIEKYKEHEEQVEADFEKEKRDALDRQSEAHKEELLAKDRILQDYINGSSGHSEPEPVHRSTSEIEDQANFESSIFHSIANTAMPKSLPPALEMSNEKYRNITFVFSATRSSADDTMRSVLNLSNSLAGTWAGKLIVLDISNETVTDYIFGGNVSTQGIRWAEGELEIDRVLSIPSTGNVPSGRVKFLSLGGSSFINDSYVLTVDWNARLRELENSGYKVIIYAGCLSDVVGRVLYRSFADKAPTRVYTKGNLVSMRSAYYTLKSMPYFETAKLHVYDLIKSKTSSNVIDSLTNARFTPVIDSVVKRKENNA